MNPNRPDPLSMSFLTSIRSLRHLRLVNVGFESFIPFTRALAELTLAVDIVVCEMQGASLITHILCMPHLCNL